MPHFLQALTTMLMTLAIGFMLGGITIAGEPQTYAFLNTQWDALMLTIDQYRAGE